jgi:hypothetical protein
LPWAAEEEEVAAELVLAAQELAQVLAVRDLVLVLVAELALAVRELVAAAVTEWEIPIPAHILVRSRFTQTPHPLPGRSKCRRCRWRRLRLRPYA